MLRDCHIIVHCHFQYTIYKELGPEAGWYTDPNMCVSLCVKQAGDGRVHVNILRQMKYAVLVLHLVCVAARQPWSDKIHGATARPGCRPILYI